MEDLVAIVAILSIFGFIPLIFIFAFFFNYRIQKQVQETIRAAVQSGTQLTTDLIKAIGAPKQPQHVDLRRGVILIASAAAIMLFGMAVGSYEDEGLAVFLGIAAFPGLIGLAYLAFHFMGLRDREERRV